MDRETWKDKHSKDDVIKLLMSKGVSYAKALECIIVCYSLSTKSFHICLPTITHIVIRQPRQASIVLGDIVFHIAP